MSIQLINNKLGRLAAGLVLGGSLLATSANAFDLEEGGYAGTDNQGHATVVWNFLHHFTYEQYYYSASHMWTWNNDTRVDNMDFAIFAGHGAPWYFTGQDGVGVNMKYVGDGADGGYGDRDLEFVAFQSCAVVPSPLESDDWAFHWTRVSGVFEGLHQALGFRNSSYQSTDQDVTETFGNYVKNGYNVWGSWLASISLEAMDKEKGCVVFHPTCTNDTRTNFAPDPPQGSTWMHCWYML
ncbi:MAG: hypothetical protein ACI841_000122 [Planctomycetota bacterium]|jgi:hypothetical protein